MASRAVRGVLGSVFKRKAKTWLQSVCGASEDRRLHISRPFQSPHPLEFPAPMKQAPNPTGEADPACVYAPDAGMWPKGEKIHVRDPFPIPHQRPRCAITAQLLGDPMGTASPVPVGWRSMGCRPDEQQAPVQAVLQPHGHAAVSGMSTCSKPRNLTCDGGRSMPITAVRESFSSITIGPGTPGM